MRSLLMVLLLCMACSKGQEPPAPTTGSPNAQTESAPAHPASASSSTTPAVEQAHAMFANVCAACHGIDGKGDGPAAASLNPKPRNYTDPAWQASVTDDQIKKTILLGGAAVGKSPMMPAQPQLKNQPEVLDELVKIIRGFGKK